MRKIWTIAWKELYVRFTDRNLLLIMIAVPLAISSVVGLAFGGLGGSDITVSDIPLAVVNHDLGNDFGVNYGSVYVDLLVPGEGQDTGTSRGIPACASAAGEAAGADTLADLTQGVLFTPALAQELVSSGKLSAGDVDAEGQADLDRMARLAVDQGLYTSAILIPQDFSQRMASMFAGAGVDTAVIDVYSNAGHPIESGVIYSITQGIAEQLATGNIAIASTVNLAVRQLGPVAINQMGAGVLVDDFGCAFSPSTNTVSLDLRTVSGESRSMAGIILVSVGSAQAMFFALFTAQSGVLSMHSERRQWTLQRLLMSPTPRTSILTGKLIGTFISVIVQLLLLMLALTLVGSLLEGRLVLIWGEDISRIAAVLISASMAVSGLGMLLAGILRTPEQAGVFGSVINIGLAVLGGAFGFQLPDSVSSISLLYWGRDAFETLATNSGDVWLNVAVLAGQGLLMFAIGLFLFNRRFEL